MSSHPHPFKTYEEAVALMGSLKLPQCAQHKMELSRCVGHLLAEDLLAPFDAPLFSNSSMDGFGIVHGESIPPAFKVIGTILAGQNPQSVDYDISPVTAVRIMTGAPIPEWVDTVVPFEDCEIKSGGLEFNIKKPTIRGAYIRFKGEDLPKGSLLLKRGTKLTAEHLMVAASFGIAELMVEKWPKIVLCTTGQEVKPLGASLKYGEIFDSSSTFLASSLHQLGLSISQRAHIEDQKETLKDFIDSIIRESEPTIIITTGAVSAGDCDFIPAIANELGFKTLFHRISIKPGRPILLAQLENIYWLALPGNPISTSVGWHFFARPLFERLFGIPKAQPIQLTLKNDVTKPLGLKCFYRAEVRHPFAWVSSKQGSSNLAASLTSEAYVILPENAGRLAAGTKVDALLI